MATVYAGDPVGADPTAAGPGAGSAAAAATGEDSGGRYINRELSNLGYLSRVLALAEDPGVPILERTKFLAIFQALLDEFFEVRVAGLKDQHAAGLAAGTDAAGLSPADQLRARRTEAE